MQFRKMRRAHQEMTDDENREILNNAAYAILAVTGDGGYPYAVPLNFVFLDGKIFMHCAKSGHKTDAIGSGTKACLTIVGEERVIPEKATTYYKSVIAFGTAKTVDDDAIKEKAIRALAHKYIRHNETDIDGEINRFFKVLGIIEFDIEHMTGKEYKPKP